jgi:hypothetical protein
MNRGKKSVAILQSNYIPWKGYFDIISSVDEFIIYDDVQYTKNDWRNRNQIKTSAGLIWLTIPVGKNISRLIREVELKDSSWQRKHWRSIQQNYRRAPFYHEVARLLEPIYLEQEFSSLSAVNRAFIDAICGYLGIMTKISNSGDYDLRSGKTECLVSLCLQAGASVYVSGPAAKDYIRDDLFDQEGISIRWFDYSGYPEYQQTRGEFTHFVSVIDLLFNCGRAASSHLSWQK